MKPYKNTHCISVFKHMVIFMFCCSVKARRCICQVHCLLYTSDEQVNLFHFYITSHDNLKRGGDESVVGAAMDK
jgi:hypothetical protein